MAWKASIEGEHYPQAYIPISSWQATINRKYIENVAFGLNKYAFRAYASVVIPNYTKWWPYISGSQPTGTLKIFKNGVKYFEVSTAGIDGGTISGSRGINSGSVTIGGNFYEDRNYTVPYSFPVNLAGRGIQVRNIGPEGSVNIIIPFFSYIEPGYTVTKGALEFVAGNVSYNIGMTQTSMSVSQE